MDENFLNQGFTEVFNINVKKELTNLSELIYSETKIF